MFYWEKDSLARLLSENAYPGRGIVLGCTPSGEKSAVAYFIMGRSENSRNRIFSATDDGIRTEAFDPSKMVDPSLIIYHPVRKIDNKFIVTNGDQTDTIRDHIAAGSTFENALDTRCFEPDAPNYTPRISGIITYEDGSFGYKLSILKSADPSGSACSRYTYSYAPEKGAGHFIHTYKCDGNPIPSFEGEPEKVAIPEDIEEFANLVWENLNNDNKVSLYICYTDCKTGEQDVRIINKH